MKCSCIYFDSVLNLGFFLFFFEKQVEALDSYFVEMASLISIHNYQIIFVYYNNFNLFQKL